MSGQERGKRKPRREQRLKAKWPQRRREAQGSHPIPGRRDKEVTASSLQAPRSLRGSPQIPLPAPGGPELATRAAPAAAVQRGPESQLCVPGGTASTCRVVKAWPDERQ